MLDIWIRNHDWSCGICWRQNCGAPDEQGSMWSNMEQYASGSVRSTFTCSSRGIITSQNYLGMAVASQQKEERPYTKKGQHQSVCVSVLQSVLRPAGFHGENLVDIWLWTDIYIPNMFGTGHGLSKLIKPLVFPKLLHYFKRMMSYCRLPMLNEQEMKLPRQSPEPPRYLMTIFKGYNLHDIFFSCLVSHKFIGSPSERLTAFVRPQMKSIKPASIKSKLQLIPSLRTMLFAVELEGLWGIGYLIPGWRGPVLDKGHFSVHSLSSCMCSPRRRRSFTAVWACYTGP